MYIFNNYSSSIGEKKNDPDAFIFTLQNPHQVPPTRFRKRKQSKYAIECDCYYGPVFGGNGGCDLFINEDCDQMKSCWINNDGSHGYDCHPGYKSSLYVNNHQYNHRAYFDVLDYEVFCRDVDYVAKTDSCSSDDIDTIIELDESLLNPIQLNISNYKNATFLNYISETHIVEPGHVPLLKEWIPNVNKWTLIYRASEHDYTDDSFHDYCDHQGPTLVIIKCADGRIFGGYTTQSWNRCICFLF